MKITLKFKDDVAMMILEGQFVAGGDGPFLRQKLKDLMEAGTKKLIVDFARVPYIDSTGLGFLAGSRATTEGAGAKMVLASINEHVLKILDEVRLTQFFTLAKDTEEALAKLNSIEVAAPPSVPAPADAQEPSSKESKGKKRPRASAEAE